jgi:hypothetical protein
LKFELEAGLLPPETETLYLRIGNDWGGFDLRTREILTTLRPALDSTRQASEAIGPDGGTIATTDAAGVAIQLTIPPDALARETLITLTPLFKSPLPDVVAPLHPGVKLEPEGLRFARPATLTLDASAMGPPVSPGPGVLLVTSPLTVQPLLTAVDPATGTLAAQLHHFSLLQGGTASGASVDFNAVLRALPDPATMTLADVEHLVALAEFAARLAQNGDPLCANGFCLAFIQTVSPLGLAALDRIVPQNCDASPATLAAINEIERQEGLRQALNGAGDLTFACRKDLMKRVIDAAKAAVDQDPSDVNLRALLSSAAEAASKGFQDLSDDAGLKAAEAAKKLRDLAVTTCQTDQAAGAAELRRLINLLPPALMQAAGLDLVRDFRNCAIRITPSSATVQVGGKVRFGVRVLPPLDPTVSWSVAPASGGSIDQTGEFTAANAGTFTIVATSVSDSTFFGEASVTVTPGGLTMDFPAVIIPKPTALDVTVAAPGANMLVGFTPTCATVSLGSGRTNANGRITTFVTPDSGCSSLSVGVTVSADQNTPPLAQSTVTASISTGAVLSGQLAQTPTVVGDRTESISAFVTVEWSVKNPFTTLAQEQFTVRQASGTFFRSGSGDPTACPAAIQSALNSSVIGGTVVSNSLFLQAPGTVTLTFRRLLPDGRCVEDPPRTFNVGGGSSLPFRRILSSGRGAIVAMDFDGTEVSGSMTTVTTGRLQ